MVEEWKREHCGDPLVLCKGKRDIVWIMNDQAKRRTLEAVIIARGYRPFFDTVLL